MGWVDRRRRRTHRPPHPAPHGSLLHWLPATPTDRVGHVPLHPPDPFCALKRSPLLLLALSRSHGVTSWLPCHVHSSHQHRSPAGATKLGAFTDARLGESPCLGKSPCPCDSAQCGHAPNVFRSSSHASRHDVLFGPGATGSRTKPERNRKPRGELHHPTLDPVGTRVPTRARLYSPTRSVPPRRKDFSLPNPSSALMPPITAVLPRPMPRTRTQGAAAAESKVGLQKPLCGDC